MKFKIIISIVIVIIGIGIGWNVLNMATKRPVDSRAKLWGWGVNNYSQVDKNYDQVGSRRIGLIDEEIVSLAAGAQDSLVVTKSGKVEKTEIVNVVETPQDRFLARQNRLMKGSIIDTKLGKARITNRPTQEGNVNAVLVN